MTDSRSRLIKTQVFFDSFELLMERWIRPSNVKGSRQAFHISWWHFERRLNWKRTPGVSAHSDPHQPPLCSTDLLLQPPLTCCQDRGAGVVLSLVLITYQSNGPLHAASRHHIHRHTRGWVGHQTETIAFHQSWNLVTVLKYIFSGICTLLEFYLLLPPIFVKKYLYFLTLKSKSCYSVFKWCKFH